jgi:hypothetical protein
VVGAAAPVVDAVVSPPPQAAIDRVAAAIAPTMASWVFLTRITPCFNRFASHWDIRNGCGSGSAFTRLN